MPERLIVKKWLNGRPAEIWVAQLKLVEHMIGEYKLEPLSPEHYPTIGVMHRTAVSEPHEPNRVEKSARNVSIVPPKPFPGGLRLAHLHFKDEIFLLNDEQWKRFSSTVIKCFKEKLSRVKTISFDQLVETSAAIDSLP